MCTYLPVYDLNYDFLESLDLLYNILSIKWAPTEEKYQTFMQGRKHKTVGDILS